MKNVKRILLLTMLMLAVTMLMGVSCYAANNGAGNEANHGFAVSDGSYVYYSADGNLYRENIGGGSKKTIIEEGQAISSIVPTGDYIYYYCNTSMYRIRKDGSDREWITYVNLVTPPDTIIQDGNMYYYVTGHLYKRNTDSGEEKEIASTNGAFAISGNKIYFNNDSSNAGARGLSSINLNGDSFSSYLVGEVGCINVYNSNIYYTKDNAIWKIPTSGGDAEKLCDTKSYYINVYEGYVYFKDDGKLTRVSVNGGEKETSGLTVNAIICICEDKIYGRDADGFRNVEVDDMPSFNSTATPKPTKTHTPTAKPTKTPTPTKTPSPTKSPTKKKDVSEIFIYSDWAEDEIQEAYDNGLIPRYFEEDYPMLNVPIWRDEFAAVAVQLYEKLSGKTLKSVNTPFTDISISDLTTEIGKAYGAGIAVGISWNEFDPWSKLNREQLATMLCRVIKKYKFPEWTIDNDGDYHMSGASGKKFADDADISDYAKDSVYFMSSVGIVQGVGNNKFAPKNTTSWEEAEGYANATIEQAIVIANRIYKTKDMY